MDAQSTSGVRWQAPMQRVLYALIPIAVSSVYFYGWRALLLILVSNLAALVTEYVFVRREGQPVSSAVFVTGTLFAFSLPPTLPAGMAALGAVFGVAFGKMVFGGFGRNVFNPALVGRAFIYISFGAHMTARWYEPVPGAMGGLVAWAPGADAVTSATPGMLLKAGGAGPVGLVELLLGRTSGTVGGTCAVLVLLGGLYILWKKAANYRIVIGALAGYLLTQGALWGLGVEKAAPPLQGLLAGSALIGIFFYATDPVSASQTQPGRWIYGTFIGVMSSLISVFSAWPAGTMFAVLLANMFAPIMDFAITSIQKGREAKAKAEA